MSIFSKLFSFEKSPQDLYGSELKVVNSLESEVASLTQEQIRAEISAFQTELQGLLGKQLKAKIKSIRPRVFALVREAGKRTLGQRHYDVQILGGMVLSESKIAEMKTGEGKTLTATLPLVLYALAKKGAHLVTVNDYLSRWQASLMGPLYHYLGLSVASIQHEASFLYDPTYLPEEAEVKELEGEVEGLVLDVKHMRQITRQQAYAADITYGTNNEFGFDYLRDNMTQHAIQLTQRPLFFAIVDEVDSILIDEARTPLIISAPSQEPTSKYYEYAKLVAGLSEHEDYTLDEKRKSASLTDEGISKVEKRLNIKNLYESAGGVSTVHHLEQALRARANYLRDRDYVVREGEVVIVDEFTGRLMFGRRYAEGLHQAIEAKEGVTIQQESRTLATITFQNLFRLYDFLSGMTGTAKTEEEEFFKIYQLTVMQVPTHRPMVRKDGSDIVYKTEKAKIHAIVEDIKQRHQKGQPVLVGTVSIAKNELLADVLKKTGVPFELLNAKHHEREASIIAQAGRKGQVTLATNIAGRGVDILLGGNPPDPKEAEFVKSVGGLHVIGTERHESRRIDNQLRGRAGRQGDAGSTQFYVSMEDDLMRIFGGAKIKSLMDRMGLPDDEPLAAKLVSRSIESAQKKIEGLNFDSRKRVLEYDDVLNFQRTVIYKRRKRYLAGQDQAEQVGLTTADLSSNEEVSNELKDLVKKQLTQIVQSAVENFSDREQQLKDIQERVAAIFPPTADLANRLQSASENAADLEFALQDELNRAAEEQFTAREQELGKDVFAGALRFVALRSVDTLWMEHLDTMDHLRDSVGLRGYAQKDPLVEYRREGHTMFQRLLAEISSQIVHTIFKVTVTPQEQPAQQQNLVTNKQVSGGTPTEALAKVGRNDPCPCGSGKKWKKCGMLNTQEHSQLMSSLT